MKPLGLRDETLRSIILFLLYIQDVQRIYDPVYGGSFRCVSPWCAGHSATRRFQDGSAGHARPGLCHPIPPNTQGSVAHGLWQVLDVKK